MHELSIEGFLALMTEVLVEAEHARHEGLEKAAELVEAEAKSEIGVYQQQAGQFNAWSDLADSTKDDRVRQGYSEDEPLLRSGDLRDSIEHQVVGHTAYVGSDNPIAEYQELGTDKIPARSFLGGALFRKGAEVAQIIGGRFTAALEGKKVFEGRMPIATSTQGVLDQTD